jgi:TetR/AcrR family transcriptional repressor of nem operon
MSSSRSTTRITVTETHHAAEPSTAQRILDVAEPLVQVRGFNGFSYADIAAELGLTTASLHYHFRSKAELGEALVLRYSERFSVALAAIDAAGGDAPAKLAAYADLYEGVLEGQRMCLCGMLAAEYQTLPAGMRRALVAFFDANESWLVRVFQAGRDDGSLRVSGSTHEAAQATLSALEGALLLSRAYGDPGRFRSAAQRLLIALAVSDVGTETLTD